MKLTGKKTRFIYKLTATITIAGIVGVTIATSTTTSTTTFIESRINCFFMTCINIRSSLCVFTTNILNSLNCFSMVVIDFVRNVFHCFLVACYNRINCIRMLTMYFFCCCHSFTSSTKYTHTLKCNSMLCFDVIHSCLMFRLYRGDSFIVSGM